MGLKTHSHRSVATRHVTGQITCCSGPGTHLATPGRTAYTPRKVLLFSHPVMPDSVTAAHQVPLSFTISQSLLKLMSIESVMPSNRLILCCPLLSCPQSFPESVSFPMSKPFLIYISGTCTRNMGNMSSGLRVSNHGGGT